MVDTRLIAWMRMTMVDMLLIAWMRMTMVDTRLIAYQPSGINPTEMDKSPTKWGLNTQR